MKIVNNTNLPYKVIGEWIDTIQKNCSGTTCYYGKIDSYIIDYKKKRYKVQIRYLKKYTEWRINENN